jgi:hypothetical protein
VQALLEIRDSLTPATEQGSVWMQHYEFAERAGDLAAHLHAALTLADQALYASSLALIRTALEHQVLDELLLIATLYGQTLEITDDQHAEFESERLAGTRWPTAVRFERRKKTSYLVRQGHDVRDPTTGQVTQQLSHYYVVLEHHQGTLGSAGVQELFHNGIGDVEEVKKWARQNQALYNEFLRWSALPENLALNGLIDSREEVALGVHYRFLSNFVHATPTGYKQIELGSRPVSWGRHRPSHHLGELVLLYVVNIARQELRAWQQFVDARSSMIRLDHRDRIDSIVAEAELAGGYLWLRCGGPTDYDRLREANRRVWKQWDKQSDIPRPTVGPTELAAADVSYYNDVLPRLIALHTGAGVEMTTGFGAKPMW